MSEVDYFVLTQILVDDIYYPDCRMKHNVLGGGGYAAAGMRFWSEHVGICSGLGKDFFSKYNDWFAKNNIHVSGSLRSMKTPHSKLVYDQDDVREEILLPGYGSHKMMQPKISEIPTSYKGSKGIYIFKDCNKDFWSEAIQYLELNSLIPIWEIHGSAAVQENKDSISKILKHVKLFSLNLNEGKMLTGKAQPISIIKDIHSLGAEVILLRLGAKGSLICDDKCKIFFVPTVEKKVVDVTGCGNASTGAFLVSYCESGGDVLQAGASASASASFMLDQFGLPTLIDEKSMQRATELAKNIHLRSYTL